MSHRNLFLSRLPREQAAALEPDLKSVRLTTDQVLHEVGQPVRRVYFLHNAVVSVVIVMADGRAVEAATHGYESVVGAVPALTGDRSQVRVFVQIARNAVEMEAKRFRERAAGDPKLLRALLRHVQYDLAESQQTAACNAIHPVKERLARWLLLTDDRVDGALLNLTQEYLSVMLGVQRTTASAAAAELKAAHLINYRRGRIEILDRAAIEARSCECYSVGRLRGADGWE